MAYLYTPLILYSTFPPHSPDLLLIKGIDNGEIFNELTN